MVFVCSRLVDKATVDDDIQTTGAVLGEAVQLAREDDANVKRLVAAAAKKLSAPTVMPRLKAVRFLHHLYDNGPACVANEIRLITDQISAQGSWRGPAHPRKGYEPYQELKDAAQSLVNLVFQAPRIDGQRAWAPVSNTAVAGGVGGRRGGMESFGNDRFIQTAPSLEPVNLDPNRKDIKQIVGGMVDRVKSIFQKDAPPAFPPPSPFDFPDGVPGGTTMPMQADTPTWSAPPPKAHITALESDVNWKKKGGEAPVAAQVADTPTKKLLVVTGNRPLPMNSELGQFRAGVTEDALEELKAGLQQPDWRVKARAVCGLEVYAQKFSLDGDALDSVAPLLLKLVDSPQASLKGVATRVATSLGLIAE